MKCRTASDYRKKQERRSACRRLLCARPTGVLIIDGHSSLQWRRENVAILIERFSWK